MNQINTEVDLNKKTEVKEIENDSLYPPSEGADYSGTPKIIRLVLKISRGYLKNEKQAGYLIIAFAVLALTISLFLILGNKTRIAEKNIFDPKTSAPDVDTIHPDRFDDK